MERTLDRLSRLWLGLAIALTLVTVADARAVTFTSAGDGPVPARVLDWAEASHAPAPLGTISIDLSGNGCPAAACASPDPAMIWLTPAAGRDEFLHELGHHFDYGVMTPASRGSFQRIMGLESRPWRDRVNSPHEQFSEAYRMCAKRPARPDRSRWGYSYKPSVSQHRRVCALIRRTIKRAPDAALARARSPHPAHHAHATPLDEL